MMLHIPEVLTPEQVARCREVMTKAEWVDGNVTAGHQSRQVKYNLQLPEESETARELGMMLAASPSESSYSSTVCRSGVVSRKLLAPDPFGSSGRSPAP